MIHQNKSKETTEATNTQVSLYFPKITVTDDKTRGTLQPDLEPVTTRESQRETIQTTDRNSHIHDKADMCIAYATVPGEQACSQSQTEHRCHTHTKTHVYL